MNPISIVMFAFAVLLLIAAAIIGSGDTGLIRSMQFTRVNDKKKYTKHFGKTLAKIALALILSGIIGLFLPAIVSVIAAVGLLVYIIVSAARRSRQYYE